MLAFDRIDWTKIISFTSSGLRIADYSTIRKAVTDMFKDVYGQDIDVSTASADGIYVNNYCLIINNILQSLKTTYSNLDVNQAQGKYLDSLAALTNVYRKTATKSIASVEVTLDDSYSADYEAATIQFVDNAGTTWTATAADIQQESYVLHPGITQTLKVSCDEAGPVKAPAGWISKTVAMDVIIDVAQNEPAIVGTPDETDAELRARRASSTGTQANSVLEALVGELYKIDGILDVKVYNNDTNGSIVAKDGTVVLAHDVYVLLRERGLSDIPDSLVGTTIYENMTPGIHTTPGTNSFEYSQSFLGQDIDLDSLQIAHWRVVTSLATPISIKLTPRQYFASETTPEKVGQAVIAFANSLRIGEDLQTRDVDDTALLADPLFRGRPTFKIAEISVGGTAKTLEEVLVESKDRCFYYTTVTVSDDDDDKVVTIS